MSNPNNCETCDHKQHQDGGWCYMFHDEPDRTCLRHTGREEATALETLGEILSLRKRGQRFQWNPDKVPNARNEGRADLSRVPLD